MRKIRLISIVFVLVASVGGAGNYLSFVEIHSDETSLDYFKGGSRR